MTAFLRLLRHETRRQRGKLIRASALAAGTAAATVLLLGLSGWFLAAAGAAGLAGPIAARGFNYMLPSAAIRFAVIAAAFFADVRVSGHDRISLAIRLIRAKRSKRRMLRPLKGPPSPKNGKTHVSITVGGA